MHTGPGGAAVIQRLVIPSHVGGKIHDPASSVQALRDKVGTVPAHQVEVGVFRITAKGPTMGIGDSARPHISQMGSPAFFAILCANGQKREKRPHTWHIARPYMERRKSSITTRRCGALRGKPFVGAEAPWLRQDPGRYEAGSCSFGLHSKALRSAPGTFA